MIAVEIEPKVMLNGKALGEVLASNGGELAIEMTPNYSLSGQELAQVLACNEPFEVHFMIRPPSEWIWRSS